MRVKKNPEEAKPEEKVSPETVDEYSPPSMEEEPIPVGAPVEMEAEDYEASRQAKISSFVERWRYEPSQGADAFDPGESIKDKFPGMEFGSMHENPAKVREAMGRAGWELIPLKGGGYAKNRLGKLIGYRPTEIGDFLRKKEFEFNERIYSETGIVTKAEERLSDRERDSIEKGRRRGDFTVGDDKDSGSRYASEEELRNPFPGREQFASSGRPIGPEKDVMDAAAHLQESQRSRGPSKYVQGYGPSKRFGGS